MLLSGPDGEREEPFDAVFVFIGLTPNSGLLRGLVELDAAGFVRTDGMLATDVPGIFAAGDVRQGSTKQAASAAGEGATAALAIRRYLEPLASGMPRRGPEVAAPRRSRWTPAPRQAEGRTGRTPPPRPVGGPP